MFHNFEKLTSRHTYSRLDFRCSLGSGFPPPEETLQGTGGGGGGGGGVSAGSFSRAAAGNRAYTYSDHLSIIKTSCVYSAGGYKCTW